MLFTLSIFQFILVNINQNPNNDATSNDFCYNTLTAVQQREGILKIFPAKQKKFTYPVFQDPFQEEQVLFLLHPLHWRLS